jgi:hypothetical protein
MSNLQRVSSLAVRQRLTISCACRAFASTAG